MTERQVVIRWKCLIPSFPMLDIAGIRLFSRFSEQKETPALASVTETAIEVEPEVDVESEAEADGVRGALARTRKTEPPRQVRFYFVVSCVQL